MNTPKLNKKLAFTKETLCELAHTDLQAVVGGGLALTQADGCTVTARRCPSALNRCPASDPMLCPISIPINTCN